MKTTLLPSLLFYATIAVLHQAPPVMGETVTYSPTDSFSIHNGNPNGVWSYGSALSANFGLFTNTYDTGVFDLGWTSGSGTDPHVCRYDYGSANNVPLHYLAFHPGPNAEAAVLRWTAPSGGTADVVGQFLPGDIGVMEVAVWFNVSSAEIMG